MRGPQQPACRAGGVGLALRTPEEMGCRIQPALPPGAGFCSSFARLALMCVGWFLGKSREFPGLCKSPGPSIASSALRAPPRGCSTACLFGLPPGLPNALAPPRGLMNPVAPPPGCRMLCHCLRWRFLQQLGKHKKVMENYFPGNVARLASTSVGSFSEKFPCRGSPRDPPPFPPALRAPPRGGRRAGTTFGHQKEWAAEFTADCHGLPNSPPLPRGLPS